MEGSRSENLNNLNWRPKTPCIAKSGKADQENIIRVGYVSANYRRHPSADNITKIIEHHDRSRFKVFGFDLFGPNASPERKRLVGAFDEFVDLSVCSDEEAANLIRSFDIDILVDQMGHTGRCRPGIFSKKPAPIQVSYLGFPGTSGMASMDYLLADETVVQPDEEEYYGESICYLPDTYWPAEGAVVASNRRPPRSEFGIPDGVMAYCCFNIYQKITPVVFDRWMQILKAVPGSVMALLEGPEFAQLNLLEEARKRGVDPNRLIFMPKVTPADHIARHAIFDLYLDTSPYNAHTTARDALLGGVLVLTCIGNTFSDRVAASLLKAAGLDDLVTHSGEAFVDMAVALANDRGRLADFKQRLVEETSSLPLFDTPRFTANLEIGYKQMYQRLLAGLPRQSFRVPDVLCD